MRRHDDFIEVGFPNDKDRLVFIKKSLEVISDISDEQFKNLAQKTYQCSYSEIHTMISKVLGKNIQVDQKKEWFRARKDGTYVGSDKSDEKAQNISFHKIPENTLRGPRVRYEVVLQKFEFPIRASKTSHFVEINKFNEKYNPQKNKEDEKKE